VRTDHLFTNEPISLKSDNFMEIWRSTGAFHDSVVFSSILTNGTWVLGLNEVYFPNFGLYNVHNTKGAFFTFVDCLIDSEVTKKFIGQDLFEMTFTDKTISFVLSFDGAEILDIEVDLFRSKFQWEFR
jgi:hypothetical protein